MVAYSFQRRFAEAILDGRKGGTMRADRRRHARPGEELQLYVGMRTKQCRLIARKTCLTIEPVILDFVAPYVAWPGVDRVIIRCADLDTFAVFDGFQSWTDLTAFWATIHRLRKWHGWHIRWAPLESRR
jgi:hypothetical protein